MLAKLGKNGVLPCFLKSLRKVVCQNVSRIHAESRSPDILEIDCKDLVVLNQEKTVCTKGICHGVVYNGTELEAN